MSSSSDKLAAPQEFTGLSPAAGFDPRAIAAALAENVGEVSFWDFAELSIPAGGGTTWEITTLAGAESAKSIPCVLLTVQDVRAYYASPFTGGNEPPDCSSPDGFAGYGSPGGNCKSCVYGTWGSGKDGRGKACQERKHLLVLTQYSGMPFMLSLPPTSLKALRQYLFRLVGEGALPYYRVVTEIGLEKTSSATGIDYSRATFTFRRVLTEVEAAAAQGYRDSLSGLSSSRSTPQGPRDEQQGAADEFDILE